MVMKIITWNVAGFRRSKSLNIWDYTEVDYDYFAEQVGKFDPDIICLQEVLIGEVDQVEVFAKSISYPFYKSVKMSPDHTGTNDWIGLGIISKEEIKNEKVEILPYPDFPLVFSDGKEASKFDKLALSAEVMNRRVVTTQLQPIHYWGYNYYEEPALSYAVKVSELLANSFSDAMVIAGDFQMSHLFLPFAELYKRLDLKDVLPDKFTRKRENGKHTKSDHILIKNDIGVLRSEIAETMTDHYLCYVEID